MKVLHFCLLAMFFSCTSDFKITFAGTTVDIKDIEVLDGQKVETDEMLRTCSRLIVMRDRKKVGELSGEELSQSSIMDTIAGGDKE